MSTIVDTIKKIIQQELSSVRVAELGLVESVYPHKTKGDSDNYGCDVRLKNSNLLLKKVPIATSHIGTVKTPNKGDLVLLTFDKGDINQPIVIGRLYNDLDRPPLNDSDEIIFRLPLAKTDDKTIKAAIRNLQSNSSEREIIIEMPPKITIQITDGMVKATAGKTEMKLDQSAGSGGKVTITAGQTRIVLNTYGDVSIEAAAGISLKANGELSLSGDNVTIKGQSGANLVSGGETTIQGSMTTVAGGSINIQGITSFSP